MKTFKDLIAEARPQDYVNRKTKDEVDAETLGMKPRSKGEVDFKDKHEVERTDHPVAGDNQFKSTKDDDESEHKGFEKEGEKRDTKLDRFMKRNGAVSQTPARRGDKRQGDMKPVLAKEETELMIEDVMASLKKIAKKNRTESVKFRNGKTMEVDPKTAGAVVKLADQLTGPNLRKLKDGLNKGESSFMKMVDFAMM